MNQKDKFRGCLLGGAVGDALGYEVEFLDAGSIFERFGSKGITEYILHNGVARISDDTQMTLFTAAGLMNWQSDNATYGNENDYISRIYFSYLDWLKTQKGKYAHGTDPHNSRLLQIPELYSRRAPGLTCLGALESGKMGSVEKPINSSKGCGGVMRVAPIGLFFSGSDFSIEEIDRIGAEAAAITHGHELGYIPAAALVHLVCLLVSRDTTLSDAVDDAIHAMEQQFASAKHIGEFSRLMRKAVELSSSELDDLDAIRILGEGWVGDEALAIALFCALRYSSDFERAMIASVNHGGDSDSTGAVTGNILGAYLGMAGIPNKYLEHLELKDLILEIADDLAKS